MIRIKAQFKKIPIQLRLWLKWLLLVGCLVVLTLTLTEINSRLLVKTDVANEFFANWYGFRTFLVEGENPYGMEMQTRIQRSAEPLGIQVNKDSSYLKQPLFGIILYLPFLFIRNFDIAFSWWLTLLEATAVFLAILGVSLVKKNLKKNFFYVGLAILLMVCSLFSFSDLQKGSPAIFSFLILLLSIKSLQQNGDELAGVLLSLMIIFPFYGWISMVFVLIWSLRQGRSKVFWWFLGTVILLSFAVALLESQWLLYYLQMWVRFFDGTEINFIGNLFASIFPKTFLLPGFIVGAMVVLLLIEWLLARRSNFILFYWTLQFTLTLEALLTIETSVLNLLAFPVSIIFILIAWEDRWKKKGRIVGLGIAMVSVILPWGLNSLHPEQSILNILFINVVLAGLILVNLYWVRWWLFRNVKLWFSDVYTLDQPGKNYEVR